MIAIPWPPPNGSARASTQQPGSGGYPATPLQRGQPYMYARPMGQHAQIHASDSGGVQDMRHGVSTRRDDPPMSDSMAHASPNNRLKVSDRWQTEYRFQYVASMPRPLQPGAPMSSMEARAMLEQTQGVSPTVSQPAAAHSHAHSHAHMHAPAAAHSHQHAMVAAQPEWDDEVGEAEAIAHAAEQAAQRAAQAAAEAAQAAAAMRSRKAGSRFASSGREVNPQSNAQSIARPQSGGPPADSMQVGPMQMADVQQGYAYDPAAYAPTPPRPGPLDESGVVLDESGRRVMMVPANHVCKENTVNTKKEPNPQAFLQSECQKCLGTPAEEPNLFIPFEPRTRVERNPKFYKYMPHELLHFVPPAGRPCNRDYPAAMCLDVYD